MKTTILIFFISLNCFYAKSQITDSEIAHSLLGRNQNEISPVLDSLKVWYHLHLVDDSNREIRWLSVEDGAGIVKVYKLYLDKNKNYIINEICVNYRHDSKEQIEQSMKISDADNIHIGYYSTDFFFKLKSNKK